MCPNRICLYERQIRKGQEDENEGRGIEKIMAEEKVPLKVTIIHYGFNQGMSSFWARTG